MAIYGHRGAFFGGVRISYLTPQINFEASRAEVPDSVIEYRVERVAAGRWSATLGATLFKRGTSNKILSGYVSAATADIPYAGVQGFTAGDDAEIVLCNLFRPVGGGVGDSGARPAADMRAVISSRAPLHTAFVLHYEQGSGGLTGDTNGTGVQLGAVGAGQEGVFCFFFPDWPTMAGTAVGTYTLQHSVDNTFAAPTTAVETTGTNPWTPTAGTPGYMVVTIDGDTNPVTDTWWRPTFTVITQTIYPACVAAIVTKEWD